MCRGLQGTNSLHCLESVQHHTGREISQDTTQKLEVSSPRMVKHLVQHLSWEQQTNQTYQLLSITCCLYSGSPIIEHKYERLI